MKRELPKVFQNRVANPIDNNNKVFYGESNETRSSVTVNDLFKPNQIYRTSVKIILKDRTLEKKVIGRTQNNLITSDNEIIPISDIVEIKTI